MSKKTFNLSFDLKDTKAAEAYKHLSTIATRKKGNYIIELLYNAAVGEKNSDEDVDRVDVDKIADALIQRMIQEGVLIRETEKYVEDENHEDEFAVLEELNLFKK